MSEEETVEKIAEEPGEEAKEDAPPTTNNRDKFRQDEVAIWTAFH